MKKQEFIKTVKEELNLKSLREANETVDKLAKLFIKILKSGDDFTFGEFGKFVMGHQSARTCHSPVTGEAIHVPAKKAVRFKATKNLKTVINE